LTQNAQTAPDRAGTFVVMGVVAVLSFHILSTSAWWSVLCRYWNTLAVNELCGSSVLFMFLRWYCDECADAPVCELSREEGQGALPRSPGAAQNQDYDRPRVKRALTGQKAVNGRAGLKLKRCQAGNGPPKDLKGFCESGHKPWASAMR